jgi:phage pi2 protein 07
MTRKLLTCAALFLVLTLALTACGDGKSTGGGRDSVTDPNAVVTPIPVPDPTPTPKEDPYEAVKNYWSEDQLTQAWGPDQVVEHLFFHPIIAYPEWAFTSGPATESEKKGLDDWMVTVDEYNKILQNVYDKGYILVAMEDVWSEVTDESGTHMVRNTLMLPEGKKPLVISFDDVNYYPYMLEQGFTTKLVSGRSSYPLRGVVTSSTSPLATRNSNTLSDIPAPVSTMITSVRASSSARFCIMQVRASFPRFDIPAIPDPPEINPTPIGPWVMMSLILFPSYTRSHKLCFGTAPNIISIFASPKSASKITTLFPILRN